jgi:hypothetical protein
MRTVFIAYYSVTGFRLRGLMPVFFSSSRRHDRSPARYEAFPVGSVFIPHFEPRRVSQFGIEEENSSAPSGAGRRGILRFAQNE